MSARATVERLLVSLVVVMSLAVVVSTPPPAASAASVSHAAYGATAVTTGSTQTLGDLDARVVLLNGWATWCMPCREEMPLLQELADTYGDRGLQVIGVSVDDDGSTSSIDRFVRDAGVTFDIWHDPDNAFARRFRTSGVPETIMIDTASGRELHRWLGPLIEDDPQTEQLIEQALAGTLGGDAPSRSAGGAVSLTIIVAFVAGLLSFLSPCVLPIVPGYASYITGVALLDMGTPHPGATAQLRQRSGMLVSALLFVSGFSTVFITAGLVASALGASMGDSGMWLARVGGAVVIVFGLHLMGIVRLPGAMAEKRVQLQRRPAGLAGTYVVGLAFGAGWTPCIGPVLAAILALAATDTSAGAGLLVAYSLGLAIPFIAAAVAIDRLMPLLTRMRRATRWINLITGGLLVLVGVLVASGSMRTLTAWMVKLMPGLNLG